MLFSEFVSVCETLQEFEALFESDTVEWDPSVGAEFKGQGGITGDVGAGARKSAAAPQRTAIKVKDFVFVPDASGKYTVAVVTAMDGREVMVLNPMRSIKAKYPISALQPSLPGGMGSKLLGKHPGSSAWVYNPKLSNPL
jgi:hypothetical protein